MDNSTLPQQRALGNVANSQPKPSTNMVNTQLREMIPATEFTVGGKKYLPKTKWLAGAKKEDYCKLAMTSIMIGGCKKTIETLEQKLENTEHLTPQEINNLKISLQNKKIQLNRLINGEEHIPIPENASTDMSNKLNRNARNILYKEGKTSKQLVKRYFSFMKGFIYVYYKEVADEKVVKNSSNQSVIIIEKHKRYDAKTIGAQNVKVEEYNPNISYAVKFSSNNKGKPFLFRVVVRVPSRVHGPFYLYTDDKETALAWETSIVKTSKIAANPAACALLDKSMNTILKNKLLKGWVATREKFLKDSNDIMLAKSFIGRLLNVPLYGGYSKWKALYIRRLMEVENAEKQSKWFASVIEKRIKELKATSYLNEEQVKVDVIEKIQKKFLSIRSIKQRNGEWSVHAYKKLPPSLLRTGFSTLLQYNSHAATKVLEFLFGKMFVRSVIANLSTANSYSSTNVPLLHQCLFSAENFSRLAFLESTLQDANLTAKANYANFFDVSTISGIILNAPRLEYTPSSGSSFFRFGNSNDLGTAKGCWMKLLGPKVKSSKLRSPAIIKLEVDAPINVLTDASRAIALSGLQHIAQALQQVIGIDFLEVRINDITASQEDKVSSSESSIISLYLTCSNFNCETLNSKLLKVTQLLQELNQYLPTQSSSNNTPRNSGSSLANISNNNQLASNSLLSRFSRDGKRLSSVKSERSSFSNERAITILKLTVSRFAVPNIQATVPQQMRTELNSISPPEAMPNCLKSTYSAMLNKIAKEKKELLPHSAHLNSTISDENMILSLDISVPAFVLIEDRIKNANQFNKMFEEGGDSNFFYFLAVNVLGRRYFSTLTKPLDENSPDRIYYESTAITSEADARSIAERTRNSASSFGASPTLSPLLAPLSPSGKPLDKELVLEGASEDSDAKSRKSFFAFGSGDTEPFSFTVELPLCQLSQSKQMSEIQAATALGQLGNEEIMIEVYKMKKAVSCDRIKSLQERLHENYERAIAQDNEFANFFGSVNGITATDDDTAASSAVCIATGKVSNIPELVFDNYHIDSFSASVKGTDESELERNVLSKSNVTETHSAMVDIMLKPNDTTKTQSKRYGFIRSEIQGRVRKSHIRVNQPVRPEAINRGNTQTTYTSIAHAYSEQSSSSSVHKYISIDLKTLTIPESLLNEPTYNTCANNMYYITANIGDVTACSDPRHTLPVNNLAKNDNSNHPTLFSSSRTVTTMRLKSMSASKRNGTTFRSNKVVSSNAIPFAGQRLILALPPLCEHSSDSVLRLQLYTMKDPRTIPFSQMDRDGSQSNAANSSTSPLLVGEFEIPLENFRVNSAQKNIQVQFTPLTVAEKALVCVCDTISRQSVKDLVEDMGATHQETESIDLGDKKKEGIKFQAKDVGEKEEKSIQTKYAKKFAESYEEHKMKIFVDIQTCNENTALLLGDYEKENDVILCHPKKIYPGSMALLKVLTPFTYPASEKEWRRRFLPHEDKDAETEDKRIAFDKNERANVGELEPWASILREPCTKIEYERSQFSKLSPARPYEFNFIPDYCDDVVPAKYVLPASEQEFAARKLPGDWRQIVGISSGANYSHSTYSPGDIVRTLTHVYKYIPVTVLAVYPDYTVDISLSKDFCEQLYLDAKEIYIKYKEKPGLLSKAEKMLTQLPGYLDYFNRILRRVHLSFIEGVFEAGVSIYDAETTVVDDLTAHYSTPKSDAIETLGDGKKQSNALASSSKTNKKLLMTSYLDRQEEFKRPYGSPLTWDANPAANDYEWELNIYFPSKEQMIEASKLINWAVRENHHQKMVNLRQLDEMNRKKELIVKPVHENELRKKRGKIEIVIVECINLKSSRPIEIAGNKIVEIIPNTFANAKLDMKETVNKSAFDPLVSFRLKSRDEDETQPNSSVPPTYFSLQTTNSMYNTNSPRFYAGGSQRLRQDGGYTFYSAEIIPSNLVQVELTVWHDQTRLGQLAKPIPPIGTVSIPVEKLMNVDAPFKNIWLPLYPFGSGEIHIMTRFIPSNAQYANRLPIKSNSCMDYMRQLLTMSSKISDSYGCLIPVGQYDPNMISLRADVFALRNGGEVPKNSEDLANAITVDDAMSNALQTITQYKHFSDADYVDSDEFLPVPVWVFENKVKEKFLSVQGYVKCIEIQSQHAWRGFDIEVKKWESKYLYSMHIDVKPEEIKKKGEIQYYHDLYTLRKIWKDKKENGLLNSLVEVANLSFPMRKRLAIWKSLLGSDELQKGNVKLYANLVDKSKRYYDTCIQQLIEDSYALQSYHLASNNTYESKAIFSERMKNVIEICKALILLSNNPKIMTECKVFLPNFHPLNYTKSLLNIVFYFLLSCSTPTIPGMFHSVTSIVDTVPQMTMTNEDCFWVILSLVCNGAYKSYFCKSLKPKGRADDKTCVDDLDSFLPNLDPTPQHAVGSQLPIASPPGAKFDAFLLEICIAVFHPKLWEKLYILGFSITDYFYGVFSNFYSGYLPTFSLIHFLDILILHSSDDIATSYPNNRKPLVNLAYAVICECSMDILASSDATVVEKTLTTQLNLLQDPSRLTSWLNWADDILWSSKLVYFEVENSFKRWKQQWSNFYLLYEAQNFVLQAIIQKTTPLRLMVNNKEWVSKTTGSLATDDVKMIVQVFFDNYLSQMLGPDGKQATRPKTTAIPFATLHRQTPHELTGAFNPPGNESTIIRAIKYAFNTITGIPPLINSQAPIPVPIYDKDDWGCEQPSMCFAETSGLKVFIQKYIPSFAPIVTDLIRTFEHNLMYDLVVDSNTGLYLDPPLKYTNAITNSITTNPMALVTPAQTPTANNRRRMNDRISLHELLTCLAITSCGTVAQKALLLFRIYGSAAPSTDANGGFNEVMPTTKNLSPVSANLAIAYEENESEISVSGLKTGQEPSVIFYVRDPITNKIVAEAYLPPLDQFETNTINTTVFLLPYDGAAVETARLQTESIKKQYGISPRDMKQIKQGRVYGRSETILGKIELQVKFDHKSVNTTSITVAKNTGKNEKKGLVTQLTEKWNKKEDEKLMALTNNDFRKASHKNRQRLLARLEKANQRRMENEKIANSKQQISLEEIRGALTLNITKIAFLKEKEPSLIGAAPTKISLDMKVLNGVRAEVDFQTAVSLAREQKPSTKETTKSEYGTNFGKKKLRQDVRVHPMAYSQNGYDRDTPTHISLQACRAITSSILTHSMQHISNRMAYSLSDSIFSRFGVSPAILSAFFEDEEGTRVEDVTMIITKDWERSIAKTGDMNYRALIYDIPELEIPFWAKYLNIEYQRSASGERTFYHCSIDNRVSYHRRPSYYNDSSNLSDEDALMGVNYIDLLLDDPVLDSHLHYLTKKEFLASLLESPMLSESLRKFTAASVLPAIQDEMNVSIYLYNCSESEMTLQNVQNSLQEEERLKVTGLNNKEKLLDKNGKDVTEKSISKKQKGANFSANIGSELGLATGEQLKIRDGEKLKKLQTNKPKTPQELLKEAKEFFETQIEVSFRSEEKRLRYPLEKSKDGVSSDDHGVLLTYQSFGYELFEKCKNASHGLHQKIMANKKNLAEAMKSEDVAISHTSKYSYVNINHKCLLLIFVPPTEEEQKLKKLLTSNNQTDLNNATILEYELLKNENNWLPLDSSLPLQAYRKLFSRLEYSMPKLRIIEPSKSYITRNAKLAAWLKEKNITEWKGTVPIEKEFNTPWVYRNEADSSFGFFFDNLTGTYASGIISLLDNATITKNYIQLVEENHGLPIKSVINKLVCFKATPLNSIDGDHTEENKEDPNEEVDTSNHKPFQQIVFSIPNPLVVRSLQKAIHFIHQQNYPYLSISFPLFHSQYSTGEEEDFNFSDDERMTNRTVDESVMSSSKRSQAA